MATENNVGHTVYKLIGAPLRALCEALEDAVDEDTLPQVVAYYLDEKLRNIPQANTYDSQIFHLVEWADSNKKIQPLIVGATLENPGNERLKQFVEDHLQLLINLNSHALSDTDLSLSLLKAVTPIVDFLDIVLPACRQTLPDFEINAKDLRKQLSNPKLNNAVKWLILLDFFLKVWQRDDKEQLYIVVFVQNLARVLTGGANATLNSWLESLPDALQPTPTGSPSDLYTERPSPDALKTLSASFIVLVEPYETSASYGIKGYVVTRLGNDDRYSRCENISLELPSGQDAHGSSASSSGDVLENIQLAFPDWLEKATAVASDRAFAIRNNYGLEFPPATHITVEFWLPFEQLITAAETWKVYGKPARLKLLNRVVGQRYKVLIRSYDRFTDPDSLDQLIKTWRKILPLSQKEHLAADVEKQYSLDRSGAWQALEKQVKQSLLGVFLAFPICRKEHNLARTELFAWMLEHGVPLVLWSRAGGLSEVDKAALEKEMQSWLTAANLTQLDPFFEKVYEARKTLSDDSLALWCDEPKRMIELKQFREGGRLRA